MGVLADINKPINTEKCLKTMKTTAFYINVPNYYTWILDVTGVDRLGVKNKTDSAYVPWISSTMEPLKKNSANHPIFNFNLFIIVIFIDFYRT